MIPTNTFGGAHNQVLQLAGGLANEGFATHVLLPDEPGNAAERLAEAGIDVSRARLRRPLARSPASWLRYLSQLPAQVATLRAAIRGLDADIVQAHGLMQLDVAIAARLCCRPLVWQLLDTRPPRWLAALLTPVMLRLSTVVMTTGTTTADAYGALRHARRPVIAFYPPAQEVPRPERNSAPRPVTFGCLANINPQKGFDVAIRSFAAANLAENAVLRLRGSVAPGHEPLRDHLHFLIQKTGSSNIDLDTTGTRSVDFLPTLDVLVLASAPRSEGTPTVIIEAMCIGLPVIATRVGGVAELVDHGLTGVLVDAGDIDQLASALQMLAGDAHLREAMGVRARDKAARSFSRDVTLQAYQRAYAACARPNRTQR